MPNRCALLLGALLLPLAAPPLRAQLARPAAENAAALPERMAGVYKRGFGNGLVSGERFRSENVLEIVPFKPGTAYFRASLQFFNGHQCDISGIAEADGGQLTFHGPSDASGAPCTLFIRRGRDGIHISEGENGACRSQTCGARGGYNATAGGPPDFKPADRRPIRYLPRLLASREYAGAVKEYEGRGK